MEISIENQPSYAVAVVKLAPTESVLAESGAMVSMSESVGIETGIMGGWLQGLLRKVLGGESLFTNTFTAQGGVGEVTLAPDLPGDIKHISMMGNTLIIQKGSFLASSGQLKITPQFQGCGCRGIFGGEGLFMLAASGMGEILLSSYGGIIEIEVDGTYIIDTGHLVAFDPSLQWHVKRVGGLKSTLFSGEGLVCEFSGRGKVWIQSRTQPSFVSWLIPYLPA